MLVFLLAMACSDEKASECEEAVDTVNANDTAVETTEPEPEVEPEPDYSMFENAELRILSPQGSEILPLNETQDFSAILVDAQGAEIPYDEIVWTTDVTEDWTFTATDFADDSLPAGVHTLQAEANLPNGDRLVYALGGIRVQHPFAGTYSGTTSIVATVPGWDGGETTVNCAGAATLVVNLEGTEAVGDSSCILNLLGEDQDTTYNFEIEITGSDLGGVAIADLVITQRDFPLTGEISIETLNAYWADTVYGFIDVEGRLELQRVGD